MTQQVTAPSHFLPIAVGTGASRYHPFISKQGHLW